MGRSRGGLIVAPSHIKMNKLLLALATGSSEEENQVERFESGLAREAREADPAKGQRKNQDKRKNKKGRSNKRKGLKGKKGGKGQKGKRNNKKNGRKNGKGNKNKKAERKPKKNGNKKGTRKNQNRMNTADARTTCLSTTCVDTAVAAMKLLKDKVDNFEKQEKRISKKSNIGSKKSAKKDVFGPTLQRLSDAAGGNLSAPVCAGNT